jgi:hypothetical protein
VLIRQPGTTSTLAGPSGECAVAACVDQLEPHVRRALPLGENTLATSLIQEMTCSGHHLASNTLMPQRRLEPPAARRQTGQECGITGCAYQRGLGAASCASETALGALPVLINLTALHGSQCHVITDASSLKALQSLMDRSCCGSPIGCCNMHLMSVQLRCGLMDPILSQQYDLRLQNQVNRTIA